MKIQVCHYQTAQEIILNSQENSSFESSRQNKILRGKSQGKGNKSKKAKKGF